MSILRHFNWEHEINFNDGSIVHLIIENPVTLRNYVIELSGQINGEEGNFILSENNQEIPLQKKIAFVPNPIVLDFDEKKINASINKDLLSLVTKNPEIQKSTFPLLSMLEKYAESIVEEYGYNISYTDVDEASVIKLLNFHINKEYVSPADKLLEWINITHDIMRIENFVILNLSLFFTKEEEELLCNECSSSKHNLLLIDRSSVNEWGNSIIIDNDNCEIYNHPII